MLHDVVNSLTNCLCMRVQVQQREERAAPSPLKICCTFVGRGKVKIFDSKRRIFVCKRRDALVRSGGCILGASATCSTPSANFPGSAAAE